MADPDPIVLRGGTVLTMDDHTVHATADVLVVGDRIEAVGPGLEHAVLVDEVWHAGMHPELPEGGKVLHNPYQYTDYQSDATHGARGTMSGDPDSSS